MGEAPKGPRVPSPKGPVVATTKDERGGEFDRPKHRRTSSLPSTMPPTASSATHSEEDGSHSGDETQDTVIILTDLDMDATTECSSSDEGEHDTDRESSQAMANVVALATFPKGKTSFAGGGRKGSNSRPSSSSIHHTGSLGTSKFQGQEQQQRPAPPKKKSSSKGLRKAARFYVGELHSEGEDVELRGNNQNKHTTSWLRKSLHRAKIAKEYNTSESESEFEGQELLALDTKPPFSLSSNLEPKSSHSINKTSAPKAEFEIESEQSPGPRSHGVEKDDGNSSSDTDTSTTTSTGTYDSNDEEEEDEDDDEHESKRGKIQSRKPSLHTSPSQIKTSRVRIADDEEDVATLASSSSRRDLESYRSDVDHELREEDRHYDTDDDRHIKKMKRRHEGNSASFSGGVSRNFQSSVTQIFFSSGARGNDSDEEGSKVISAKNLAPMVNENTLHDFFGGCGTVTFVNISRNEIGVCSGSAYVEFDSEAAARKAVQKTGKMLLERVVFCCVAHETATSRHVESKPPPQAKPAEAPRGPAAASSGRSGTGGGNNFQSLFKTFHRAEKSDESVRGRHKKSKSSESYHPLPRGGISPPGDTTSLSSGNEQSVHDRNANGESTRGGKATGDGGSKKKLFGLSSGTKRGSAKLAGSQHHSQSSGQSRDPEPEQQSTSSQCQAEFESRDSEINEVQSRCIEDQPREIQSRGIEVKTRGIDFQSRAMEPHSSPIPEFRSAFQEGPNEAILVPSSKEQKKRRWRSRFGKWRRKHRWVKISVIWKWVEKPRWHWWHFANLSARWGKARRDPSVESIHPPADFQAEPPEGYPEGYPHFSRTSEQLLPSPGRIAAP